MIDRLVIPQALPEPASFYGSMPMTPASHSRKRRRSAIEEELVPQPPWKRARRPFQSSAEANRAYWDSLSELCLTRRALKEHNRRNRTADDFSEGAPGSQPQRDLSLAGPCPSTDLLKRFARHGGPDLCDLRGSAINSKSATNSQSATNSRSTGSTAKTSHRRSSAYHRDFQQHLIDHGIYPDDYKSPGGREAARPENEEDLLAMLAQPRRSLSPSRFSQRAFLSFKQANSQALTESVVFRNTIPTVLGDADILSAGDLPFGNLEPLTDGTLVDAKPDLYDGAYPTQLDPRIRKKLGPYIIPSTQQGAPLLPNFFMETKGPDGSGAVAQRQACYNGAIGARAMRAVQMYNSTQSYDGSAYTITSTYHQGTLKLYTTHPTRPPDSAPSPKYHMTQLGAWALINSRQTFQEGAGALRNARDWAKGQRDQLIATANETISDAPAEVSSLQTSAYSMLSPSTNQALPLDSETSADELAQPDAPDLSRRHRKRGPQQRTSVHSSAKRRRNPGRKRA